MGRRLKSREWERASRALRGGWDQRVDKEVSEPCGSQARDPGERTRHTAISPLPHMAWTIPTAKTLRSHVSFGCLRWAKGSGLDMRNSGSTGNKSDAMTVSWDHQCPQSAPFSGKDQQGLSLAAKPSLQVWICHSPPALSHQLPNSDLSLVQILPTLEMLQCPIYNGPMVLMLQWSTVLWAAGNRASRRMLVAFQPFIQKESLRPSGWGVMMTPQRIWEWKEGPRVY